MRNEYSHESKRWRAWRDIRQLTSLSANLHEDGKPVEDMRAMAGLGRSGAWPGAFNSSARLPATTLRDFFAVAKKTCAKLRPLPQKKPWNSQRVHFGPQGMPPTTARRVGPHF